MPVDALQRSERHLVLRKVQLNSGFRRKEEERHRGLQCVFDALAAELYPTRGCGGGGERTEHTVHLAIASEK